jgi:hypothetical protein
MHRSGARLASEPQSSKRLERSRPNRYSRHHSSPFLGHEQAKKRRGAKRAFLRKLPKTAIWRIVLTDHARLPACARLELTECPAFEPGFLYPVMIVPIVASITVRLAEATACGAGCRGSVISQ